VSSNSQSYVPSGLNNPLIFASSVTEREEEEKGEKKGEKTEGKKK
jgi:hypothetical protein